jgi:hypothetical protein
MSEARIVRDGLENIAPVVRRRTVAAVWSAQKAALEQVERDREVALAGPGVVALEGMSGSSSGGLAREQVADMHSHKGLEVAQLHNSVALAAAVCIHILQCIAAAADQGRELVVVVVVDCKPVDIRSLREAVVPEQRGANLGIAAAAAGRTGCKRWDSLPGSNMTLLNHENRYSFLA